MKKIPQLFIAAVAAVSAAVSQAVSIETIEFDEGYGITTEVPFDGSKTYTADAGATVSFTAVGENFECWFDGAGEKLSTDRTLTFTAEADTKIIPFFKGVPWVYSDGSNANKHIYNMYGEFGVSISGTRLTLTKAATNYAVWKIYIPIIDFTGPMLDANGAPSSAYLGTTASNKNCAWPSSTKEVWLPHTMDSVGSYAMSSSVFSKGAYIKIEDDNVLTSFGTYAFQNNIGMTGDYVFTNLTGIAALSLYGTKITSCVFGSNVTSVGDRALYGISTLTNLVFLSTTSLSISYNSTQKKGYIGDCPNLKEYTFYCYPTFTENWNKGSKTGTGVRVFVPKHGTGWDDVVGGDNFTMWGSAGAMQAEYYQNFGNDAQTPIGYMTVPFAAWLVAIQEEGEATAAELTIASNGEELGEVDPAYGVHPDISEPVDCSVTVSRTIDSAGTTAYQCTGWTTEMFDDVWVPSGSGSGTSHTYTPNGNEIVKLTWNWEPFAYQVKTVVPEVRSVVQHVASNAGLDGADDFYLPGTVVTYTAVGENFERWYGVPDGVDATQREITFTVTEPVVIAPFFGGVPWTYAGSRITNAYWNVSATISSGTSLMLNKNFTYSGCVPVLDMTGPITNSEGNTYYIEKTVMDPDWGATVEEVRLPLSLKSINDGAMSGGQFALGYSTMVLSPDNIIDTLGAGAFSGNTGLTGDVVFTNLASMGAYPFRDTKITSCVLGPNLTYISDRAFENCTLLTNLVCLSDTTLTFAEYFGSGKQGSLHNCSALSEYTFHCFPTFGDRFNTGAKQGTGVRVFIPYGNEGWNTALSNEVYTGWSKCGDKQAEYYENFGANAQRPSGYMTEPFEAWVLRFGSDNGTMLMLK